MAPVRVLSILVAVSLALLAVAVPATATLDAPMHTPGDFWTYRANSTLMDSLRLGGTVTIRVVSGPAPASVQGATVDVFRLELEGQGTVSGHFATDFGDLSVSGVWILTGETLLEGIGLKPVLNAVDLRANGTVQYGFAQPFSLRVQNTTTFTITEDTWRYPLDVGSSGVVATHFNYTEDAYVQSPFLTDTNHTAGEGDLSLQYSMEARVPVNTSAGTFDAYRSRETWPDGSFRIAYASAAVGNDAASTLYNTTGSEIGEMSLTSFRYQSMEPFRLLGLTLDGWLLLAVVIAAAAAGIAILRRRRRNRPTSAPPADGDVTSGPQGP